MCRAAAGSKILLLEEEILSWCVDVGEGGAVLVDLSENTLDLRNEAFSRFRHLERAVSPE